MNSLELHKDVYIPKSASIASSLQTYSVTSSSSEDQDNESFTDCVLEGFKIHDNLHFLVTFL